MPFRKGPTGYWSWPARLKAANPLKETKRPWNGWSILREVLSELGLEPERIQFETVGPGMVASIPQDSARRVEDRIRKLGISPVRRAKGIQRIYDQFTFPVDSKTFVI